MSKEHKNKRDTKKKPAMSPKEKKAEKLAKKDTKNVLGNWAGSVSAYQLGPFLNRLMLPFEIDQDRKLRFIGIY